MDLRDTFSSLDVTTGFWFFFYFLIFLGYDLVYLCVMRFGKTLDVLPVLRARELARSDGVEVGEIAIFVREFF